MQRNRKSISLSPRKYDLSGLPDRYFNSGELAALLHLCESVNPKAVVEFGCNNGRTAAAALRNISSIETYVGIDVLQGYETIMPCQRREVPPIPGELALSDPRFHLIVSKRGSFDLTSIPACDAAFIDADHSADGVMNDYALAKAAVRTGGIIIFHDDNCLPTVEVTQTLNALCEGGAQIVHVAGTWLAYERIGNG